MTLKEKFQNIPSDYLPLSNNQKNKCVLIADEFAIEFAYWLTDSENKNVKGQISIEELLEIYKKENEL